MKFSLYQRLSLSLLLVFIIIISVFYLWSVQLEKQARYESEQSLHLSLAANLARDNPLLQQGVYDHKALKNLFHTLMVLGPAFEFYFLDPTGNILTHSLPTSLIKRNKVNVSPLIRLTQNQADLPVYGDDPQHQTRQKIFSAAPVFNGATLQGYLYVIVAGERYETAFEKQNTNRQVKLSMVIFIGAMLFLFIVMLGLFAYFTRPLRLLNREITALKSAGFDTSKVKLTHWKPQSHNEVHMLGEVFEAMAKQIHEQLLQLKQNDSQRRELLADISHDLRTPLASLQGYIETISLNANSITAEQQQKYIDVTLKNARQLKQLIDQIFELAHIEGGQVTLNLESFNLAELLYDVVAKFTLKAQEKNISIIITPQCSTLLIHSDIAKLERVVSNLIENAIRHTSNAGQIAINIEEQEKHCFVKVRDNGTGIKTEELSYIFDTRYRASNAIQSDEKHTGLGLAITKKILELLKSEIHVTSELGKGTEFSFDVKVAS
ncbi:MAG: HAMP domain-containing sensor histidine kinase [Thalassotalea sp.]|nr:HAMP domain-containing sensor histidine kinase [Thalassotalea sp.]